MPHAEGPSSWRDPQYISTIVVVLATGGLFFYSAIVDSAPSTETIIFVLFWILVPTVIAYEAARRWLKYPIHNCIRREQKRNAMYPAGNRRRQNDSSLASKVNLRYRGEDGGQNSQHRRFETK